MNAISRISISIAAIGLSLASASAFAANAFNAAASLSEVTYSIVDANGIRSTPVLTNDFSHVSSSVYVYRPFLSENDDRYGDGISPVSAQTVVEQGHGSASTRDQPGTFVTTANLAPGLSNAILGSASTAYFSSRSAFILPAHATFSFSGLASGYLNRAAGGAGYAGTSSAYVTLTENFSPTVAQDEVSLTSASLTAFDSYARTLALSYTNLGDTDLLMHLDIAGGAVVTNIESAIPEPSAYGMLAGGLLLLGAVARRKSKAA